MPYPFQKIEKKWQKFWEKENFYKAVDFSKKPKKYILIEFPYPSGDGLHVGHVRGYSALDAVSRKKRMEGYNVLFPIGWDAFGLPTENYAIKKGIHPSIVTEQNIKVFKKQLKSLGLSFDWSREINTTDPNYYKWTQWIFLQFFKHGLAYQAEMPINWCPQCKIGLANEEVVNGRCERCSTETEKRNIKQWLLRITKYADRLLKDLDKVDYLDKIKIQQQNWIGRSKGAYIKFQIPDSKFQIEIFTTRPDTLFGATYLVLAPEHELIKNLEFRIKNLEEVKKYIVAAKKKKEFERGALVKQKTGVCLEGMSAINPVNSKKIPIYVADFVLSSYGTGAIMSVPAHDERDFEFAKTFRLPIIPVVKEPLREDGSCHIQLYDNDISQLVVAIRALGVFREYVTPEISVYEVSREKIPGLITVLRKHKLGTEVDYKRIFDGESFTLEVSPQKIDFLRVYIGDGKHINSEFLNGLRNEEAIRKMISWLRKKGIGRAAVIYKLRDWIFSRQHYWGEPIPIIHCEKCGAVPVPEKDLPVKLPYVKKYQPTKTGQSPLEAITDWVNVKCPKCHGSAKRETDTMPNWAGSSWYFLRYIDPKNKYCFADFKKLKYWLPIDLYNGGMEHTTLHLLYSRFWHKFLYDLKLVPTPEPYAVRCSHGMVLAEDGRKMSKSFGNVINPDEIVKKFGADTLRLYEMFMGPFDQAINWSNQGVVGLFRFLNRVYQLKFEIRNSKFETNSKLKIQIHKSIKKISEDLEEMKFNTAVSQLMILVNEFEKQENLPREIYETFLKLLAPLAPHLAEELWAKLGHKKSIHLEKWPKYDSKLIKEEKIILVIQINGKVRDKIETKADIPQKEAEDIALNSEKIKKWLEKKEIKKTIFIAGKLINFVVVDKK